jgi:hypothetical protein
MRQRALSAVVALGVLVAPAASRAAPTRVVVLPIETKGGKNSQQKVYTSYVMKALAGVGGIQALEARAVSKGFDAASQAAQCGTDVFCLVQIGEAVEADRLIIGHVRRDPGKLDELRLSLVDVVKSSMIDTLKWDVPPREGAMEEAVYAGTRHLIIKPDVRIAIDLEPKDALITLYGERVGSPPYPPELPYWSGVYYGRITREGYEPKEVRIDILPKQTTRVAIELDQDPLYVRVAPTDPDRGRRTEPRPPPRTGGTVETAPSPPSPLANPYAWGIVAVGVGGTVAGGMIMKSAQDSYNQASGEARYLGATRPSSTAIKLRDDARNNFSLGAKLTAGGAIVAAGGLIWMLYDGIMATRPQAPPVALVPELGVRKGLACELSF